MTATISYGATVIGLGMIGVIALMIGMTPAEGDHNNLIPQMASTYLSPFMVGVFFIMVVGSLSSTADSDLAALSSIMMTDIYGKNLARGKVKPSTMLWVGRITMVVATMTSRSARGQRCAVDESAAGTRSSSRPMATRSINA